MNVGGGVVELNRGRVLNALGAQQRQREALCDLAIDAIREQIGWRVDVDHRHDSRLLRTPRGSKTTCFATDSLATYASWFLAKSARSWRFRLLDRMVWIRPLRCQRASLGVQQQNLIEGVDFVFRQTNACGRYVVDEVGDFGGPRNGQHDWRSRQKPCQSDLRRRRVLLRCHTTNETIRAGKLTRCQGKPRDEDDVVLLTVFENVFRTAVRHAIAILDARNGNDRARVVKLAYAHFR